MLDSAIANILNSTLDGTNDTLDKLEESSLIGTEEQQTNDTMSVVDFSGFSYTGLEYHSKTASLIETVNNIWNSYNGAMITESGETVYNPNSTFVNAFDSLNCINYLKSIAEVTAMQTGAIRHGKKTVVIDCPEGFKVHGNQCVRMSAAEHKSFVKRAIKSAKTRSHTSQNHSLKSREKSMALRSKLPTTNFGTKPATI
jgi:hypothetical protein